MTVGEHTVAPVKRKPKPWTQTEENQASKLAASMSIKEVAKVMGRTRQSVESKLRKLAKSPKKNNRKKWADADDELLLQYDIHEASCKLGRSLSACKSRRFLVRLRNMKNHGS